MANNKMGPLQLVAFGFQTPNFQGEIIKEIKKLNDNKIIRLVDGIAIQKDRNGEITALEASQLSLKEATRYGAIIGALLGIGSGDKKVAKQTAEVVATNFYDRYEYGLDKEDVTDIAQDIPNGSAAILLLIEHLWAIPLRDAVRKAGGTLLAQDFLSPELLISLGKDMYATHR